MLSKADKVFIGKSIYDMEQKKYLNVFSKNTVT